MRSLRWPNVLALFSALVVMPVAFQNCGGGSDQKVRFTSQDQGLRNSGNGTAYEGKPEPGVYYRVIPNFTCADGNPSIAAKINVTSTDMTLFSVNRADCSTSLSPVDADQVETPSYNRQNLGHEDGIYKKADTPPNPTVAAAESWCRSLDGSFDVLVEQPSGASLSATLRSATGANQSFVSTRSQNGSSLNYSAAGMSLLLQLNSGTGKVAGTFSSPLANGAVSCRTTMKAPLAMNYFVMSRDTTQANFGGIAGANAFCLNQLRNNTFKGKVNATIDATHVFAFICDGSRCNNLPANRTFSFAMAGNSTVGGETFVTDANGSGPGNMETWDRPEVFGGNYLYWSGRDAGPDPRRWPTAPSPVDTCTNWSSNYNAAVGLVGITYPYNTARWDNGGNICSDRNRLLCYVVAP